MTATARLDLRLTARDRARIDRAAALAGLPLATFVRTAVLREAERTVAAESIATLSLPSPSASWRPSANRLRRTRHCGVP